VIETRLLRQFIAVAEELHFHRAAERLHMAQPPLSQAIGRLEQRLGFALFTRHSRGVALTAAGAAFVQTARATLATLQQGIVQARHVAEGIAGQLRIGSLALAGYPLLLNALKQFRADWPKVQPDLQQGSSAQLVENLLDGQLDIAVVRQLPIMSERLSSRLLLEEEILLAVPSEHSHAGETSVSLADFADEDFVFTPQALGAGYHQQLLDLCQSAGFYPRISQQAAQLQTLINLVGCGFGIALVPAAAAQANAQPGVRFCHLLGASPRLGLYLVWRSDDPSPLPGRFIALTESADTDLRADNAR